MLDLRTLSSADLAHLLGGLKPTVLIGSAVSRWEPTNLPTGQDFTKGVLDAVFDPALGASITDRSDRKLLQALLASLPFEMLLERCPDQHVIGSLIASMFGASTPNPVHEALAGMAAGGTIDSIITTNYDLALDTALTDSKSGLAKVVVESQVPRPADRVYFKVHGSTDHPGSLVFSLRLESRLPAWKRDLLSRCIKGRPLVVIGYSGLDFEICPEISRLDPTMVAWNFLAAQDAGRPGPSYLSAHGMPPEGLIGGMDRLFELLGYPVGRLIPSTSVPDVGDVIRRHFSTEQLLLWRARLLNTMGFCRLSASALGLLQARGFRDADLEYAQTLFQQGAYRSSARLFLAVAQTSSEPRERALRLLDACDAFRCFGDWPHSYALIRRAERIARISRIGDSFLHCRISMKKLLLLQEIARLVPWGEHIIRSRGRRFVRPGIAAALESGEWLVFQQFMLIAERWSIPVSDSGQTDSYDPPPSKEGYRHLGFRIGELLSLLDRTRSATVPIAHGDFAEAVRTAIRLGSHPTAWKLAARASACFPRWRRRYRRLHWHHLGQCEYRRYLRWRNRIAK